MTKAAFRDSLALKRLDHLGVRFALGDQFVETFSVDRGKTSGHGRSLISGFDSDFIHEISSPYPGPTRAKGYRPFCIKH